MKATLTLFLVLMLISTHPVEAGRIPKPVWDTAIKIVTGVAAAFSAAESAEAKEVYEEHDAILDDLRAKGIDPSNGALYQLYFRIDPSASGRWFTDPNVYALVQLEGQGDFVPASIAKGYKGQPYTVTIFGHQIRPGGRVLVHLLDDKQWWNTAWNSLLQTEVPVSLGGKWVTPIARAEVTATATIQLIDKDITFQPPGYLATADITVPKSSDGIWLADGDLIDEDQNHVGKFQFGQIWIPSPAIRAQMKASHWSMIFWGGLAVVLVVVFGKQILSRTDTQQDSGGNG